MVSYRIDRTARKILFDEYIKKMYKETNKIPMYRLRLRAVPTATNKLGAKEDGRSLMCIRMLLHHTTKIPMYMIQQGKSFPIKKNPIKNF